jgi:quercetin dioxygenase-like cupin family protein
MTCRHLPDRVQATIQKKEQKEHSMLKKIEVFKENQFDEKSLKTFLVHESPYMKVINFNFKAGQELPIHSHDIEGQLTIAVLEGKGQFLGAEDAVMEAATGDLLISDISEPHGLRAVTDMRVLVTIAPPI